MAVITHRTTSFFFAICAATSSIATSQALGSYPAAIARDQSAEKLGEEPWSAGPHSIESLRSAPVTLIPYPNQIEWQPGKSLVLSGEIKVSGDALGAITALNTILANSGISATMTASANAPGVRVSIGPAQAKEAEGYILNIDEKGVEIIGHDAAGVFYAVQTLRQMLRTAGGKTTLPYCHVIDAPAFALRGFMHDTGRNFQTIDSLKAQLDRLAAYKLNVFHRHLTDNPAWRPESRIYPQLNDPKFRQAGRDPEASYSFDEIRSLIAYAKARHIVIIPELDMPGHSQYFEPTFGFKMGTPQGIDVLEKLIDEFCAEIPKEDCPYLHLGADEVHIADPAGFMKRMTAVATRNGRTPILWMPGLVPADDKTLVQIWGDYGFNGDLAKIKNPIIDSGGGYLNSFDAQLLPQRYFFWQPGRQAKGDKMHPGGILCMWPDIRVDDKRNILRHSPVWPTMLAFSETMWQGRKTSAVHLMSRVPRRGSEAWIYLREFEARLADHRDRYFGDAPFPWIKQATIEWQSCGPFPHEKGSPWDQSFEPEKKPEAASYEVAGKPLTWQPASGTTYAFPDRNRPIPSTCYIRTWFHSDEDRVAYFMVGFESIPRATRTFGGIPAQGKWDGNGGSVWINGNELTPPVWNNPGKNRFEKHTWGQPGGEIPLTDEEEYWCREPIKVELKKGNNLVLMRLPYTYGLQTLQGVCAPVRNNGARWVEDESIKN